MQELLWKKRGSFGYIYERGERQGKEKKMKSLVEKTSGDWL